MPTLICRFCIDIKETKNIRRSVELISYGVNKTIVAYTINEVIKKSALVYTYVRLAAHAKGQRNKLKTSITHVPN